MIIDGQIVRCVLTEVQLDEFSAVDVPAHKGARAAITKRETILQTETPKELPTMSDLATVNAQLAKALEQVAALTGQVTDLTKARDAEATRATHFAKVAGLSVADLAHYRTLPDDDGRVFVGKSAAQRAADVAAADAADPVEVTLADGQAFRKSAGADVIGLAKRTKVLEDQQASLRADAERVTFEKRATDELGFLGGTPEGRIAVVKAIAGKALTDDERKAAGEVLKSANAVMKLAFKKGGSQQVDPTVDAADPSDRIDAIAKKYSAEKKIPFNKAYDIVTDPRHDDHSEDALAAMRELEDAAGNR